MPHRKLIPFLYGAMPQSVSQTMGEEMFSEAAKAQFPWLNPEIIPPPPCPAAATIDPSMLAAFEDAVDALTLHHRPVEVCRSNGFKFPNVANLSSMKIFLRGYSEETGIPDAAGGSADANSR
jgi:hypothetical protein